MGRHGPILLLVAVREKRVVAVHEVRPSEAGAAIQHVVLVRPEREVGVRVVQMVRGLASLVHLMTRVRVRLDRQLPWRRLLQARAPPMLPLGPTAGSDKYCKHQSAVQ